jgi:hypothetical protein
MAKMTTNSAYPVASFETPDGKVKFTLRSDGKVLRQFRIDGSLEGATISGDAGNERTTARLRFNNYAAKRGAKAETVVVRR